MERLTQRNNNGNFYYHYCFRENTCGVTSASEKCDKCELTRKVCNKLGEYEEQENKTL